MRICNFDDNKNFLDLKIKSLVLGPKPSQFGGGREAVGSEGRGRRRETDGNLRFAPTELKACAFGQGLESSSN